MEVVVAAAVIAANLRDISSAPLDDEAVALLSAAFDPLIAPPVADRVSRILRADNSIFDEQTAAYVFELFGGQAADGRQVPVDSNAIREALRLPTAA